ncbi:MAG: hypothetical protein OXF04_04325, partial [bacterium]|nr:hypothetical protein [bacterium]
MKRSLLHKLLALMAVLALAAAACGNDDDDAPAQDAAPAPTEAPADEPMDDAESKDDDDHDHDDHDHDDHEHDDDHEHEHDEDEEHMDDEGEEHMDDGDDHIDDEEMAASRTYGAFTYEIDFEPSTRGVSDDVIRLGAMAQDALYGGFTDGINARLGRANRDGELPGGRMVELVQFVDDGSDPGANFEGARSMVENDEVFGIMV